MPRIPTSHQEKVELQNLGFILREIRIALGFNSKALFASTHGISLSVHKRCEAGENMNLLSIIRLCEIYKVTPAELMDLWVMFNSRSTKNLYKEKLKILVARFN